MADRYRSRSDAELLRRARRDPDAFITACRRHGEPLRMWLRRELGDELLAQDVLAETFAAAWLAAGRFRDQGEGAAPWQARRCTVPPSRTLRTSASRKTTG
jgi:DNA-directed RNA polymerase specialized sigma24 family protein